MIDMTNDEIMNLALELEASGVTPEKLGEVVKLISHRLIDRLNTPLEVWESKQALNDAQCSVLNTPPIK